MKARALTFRRALRTALGLVLLIAAAAAIAWSQRVALAEWWLTRELAAFGLAPASLRVASLEVDGIAIEAIAVGAAAAPDLAVERVEAAWSRDSLRAGRLVALRVRGVDLRARFDDTGLSLGALDLLWGSDAATDRAPVLPAPEIALEDARIHVATLRGPATGTFGGELRGKGEGIEGAFSLDLAGAGLAARGRLSLGGALATPSFRVRLDPLAAGDLALRLDLRGRAEKDGVVAIEKGSLRLLGGALRIGEVRLDPRAKRTALAMRVEDLDLAALLALATVDGLAGTGRIGGELPLVREGPVVRVDGGALRASGAGTLRYAPSASVRELATSRPGDLGLAVEAFSDFRYEALEARVSGELAGALAIGLHVRGTNPSFQGGRPVELNLNLETRLADLVQAGTASYRVPEQIEERVRKRAEER